MGGGGKRLVVHGVCPGPGLAVPSLVFSLMQVQI